MLVPLPGWRRVRRPMPAGRLRVISIIVIYRKALGLTFCFKGSCWLERCRIQVFRRLSVRYDTCWILQKRSQMKVNREELKYDLR